MTSLFFPLEMRLHVAGKPRRTLNILGKCWAVAAPPQTPPILSTSTSPDDGRPQHALTNTKYATAQIPYLGLQDPAGFTELDPNPVFSADCWQP